MTILLVEPGKKPRQAEIDPTLEAMQAVVGGHIQAIFPFPEAVALIANEEGKVLSLPLNRSLRNETEEIYDIIAGTFFLCGAPPTSSTFTSLTKEQYARYEKLFLYPEIFLTADDTLICFKTADSS